MASDLSALAGAVIVFDLDGTLVDTARDIVDALNVLLEEEGLAALPLEIGRNLIGGGARALIERAFARAEVPLTAARLDALHARVLALYGPRIALHSRPYPGVEATLAALAAAGARLVVCTNKQSALSQSLIAQLGLDRFFTAVVGPDTAAARKPDPRHLLAAVRAAGGDAARAVMVGDSASDAQAARAAGIPLILVSYGYTEIPPAELLPDLLIDHFSEAPQACLRLLGAGER